jgi:MFS family permease
MFLLNGALLGIWASRIPTIREAQGLDKSQFGLLLLVMAVGALLSFPVAGRLADRFGAVLLTRILAVLYAVSLVGIALAPVSVLALGATMFLFGATHGAMDVTMNSWATEVEKAAGRPIMSSFHALWSVGTGLGALSGFFAGQIDLETSLHFLLAAVIFSAVCLPFSVVAWKSETVAGGSGSGAPLVSLPKGILVLVGLVAFCTTVGEGGMVDWSSTFLIEVANVTEARAALGFTAYSVLMVITRLLGDRCIQAIGPCQHDPGQRWYCCVWCFVGGIGRNVLAEFVGVLADGDRLRHDCPHGFLPCCDGKRRLRRNRHRQCCDLWIWRDVAGSTDHRRLG